MDQENLEEERKQSLRKNNQLDTIVALATPPVGSAIGVIRISGENSLKIIFLLFQKMDGGNYFSSEDEIESRRIYHGVFVDGNGEPIDEVLIHCARNPRSYTGEDTVEINCHGGPFVLKRIVNAVVEAGARVAEPGEFTRRGFLNGKLDLARAEAVVDISNAATERARKSAFSQLKGDISVEVERIHERMMNLGAEVEAWIDFPEDDVDMVKLEKIGEKLESILKEMNDGIYHSKKEIYLREGLEIAIIGRPNVGKSSVFNYFCRESRVIVSDVPGTTRDIVSEYVSIGDIPVKLYDTAGIRRDGDMIEKQGIEMAIDILPKMDLVLLIIDSSEKLHDEDMELLKKTEELNRVILLNKSDLEYKLSHDFNEERVIKVSAITGDGFDEFDSFIEREFSNRNYEGLLVTNSRHLHSLKKSVDILEETIDAIRNGLTIDIISEGIRSASRELSEILGINYSEDLLDRIFSKFCIGK